MSYVKVLLLGMLYFSCVQARFHFGKCSDAKFDLHQELNNLPKTWYVYGREPSRWVSGCYNYTISDPNADYSYNVTEAERRTLLGVTENEYTLNTEGSELIFKKKSWLSFGSTKWTVVAGDVQLKSFMVLYSCGWITENAEIWVTDLKKLEDNDVKNQINQGLASINYKESEFQIRKQSDCL